MDIETYHEYLRNYISTRYAIDDTFRKKQNDYVKLHHRNKYATDPQYREYVKSKNREYYAKIKARQTTIVSN